MKNYVIWTIFLLVQIVCVAKGKNYQLFELNILLENSLRFIWREEEHLSEKKTNWLGLPKQ